MVHGGQEFVWGEPVVSGDVISTTARSRTSTRRPARASTSSSRCPPTRTARRRPRHLDQDREGRVKPGDDIPELKVTPDRYLPHRYAGASGDFNPIHIDTEFAQQVGLPRNILHGLYSMALVARAAAATADGDPRALKRLSVQFRGMGVPEEEIIGHRHGARGRRAGRWRRPRATTGSSATPRPRSAAPAPKLVGSMQISVRQSTLLRKVVEGYQQLDAPVGSKWLAGQVDVPWGPSTVRSELARLEEFGLLEHPAHLRGTPAHRLGLPLLRGRAAGQRRPARGARAAGAQRHAPRGRRGHARHHRAAVAGHRPAGAGVGARRSARPPSTASRCCCCSRRWPWSWSSPARVA